MMSEEPIKAWIQKGELTVARKNNGNPSKRDIAEDYACIWFCKESIPDRRGMTEVTLNQDDDD